MLPYRPLPELMGLQDSKGFPGKVLSYAIFLNSQGKLKLKWIRNQSLQRGFLEKLAEASWRVRILTTISWISVMLSWERKVKFHVVPFFPNPDLLVIDASSPRDNYCLLVCLVLCPKSLAWLSPCLGQAGYWFFSYLWEWLWILGRW